MTAQSVGRSVDILKLTREYKNKNVPRRWLGAWIDFMVLFSMLLIPDAVLGNARYQSTIIVWFSLLALYFPITEGLWGRSLGKLLTGTTVVTEDGQIPGIRRAIVRTLLRLAEVNPVLFGGIPAGIVALKSAHGQRLGDMAAKTYVVLAKDLN